MITLRRRNHKIDPQLVHPQSCVRTLLPYTYKCYALTYTQEFEPSHPQWRCGGMGEIDDTLHGLPTTRFNFLNPTVG